MADGKVNFFEGGNILADIAALVEEISAHVVNGVNIGWVPACFAFEDRVRPAQGRHLGLVRNGRRFQPAHPGAG